MMHVVGCNAIVDEAGPATRMIGGGRVVWGEHMHVIAWPEALQLQFLGRPVEIPDPKEGAQDAPGNHGDIMQCLHIQGFLLGGQIHRPYEDT